MKYKIFLKENWIYLHIWKLIIVFLMSELKQSIDFETDVVKLIFAEMSLHKFIFNLNVTFKCSKYSKAFKSFSWSVRNHFVNIIKDAFCSPSYYAWGNLVIVQVFDFRCLADVHVLESGESKKRKISMMSSGSLLSM